MAKRKPLSKKPRFEVFKRDSFRCQYCGAEAPSVLLHVDHIAPVADGGTNDILNLVTACAACNAGKAAVPLSDQSALAKQKQQIAELQERREQLEMMMEWRQGPSDLTSETIAHLAQFWSEHSHGWTLNEQRKAKSEEVVGPVHSLRDHHRDGGGGYLLCRVGQERPIEGNVGLRGESLGINSRDLSSESGE
jgi:hypothetical protein